MRFWLRRDQVTSPERAVRVCPEKKTSSSGAHTRDGAGLNKSQRLVSRCGWVCLFQPTADRDQERINRRGDGRGRKKELISMIHCFVLPSVCHKLCRAGWERLCEGRVFGTKEEKKKKLTSSKIKVSQIKVHSRVVPVVLFYYEVLAAGYFLTHLQICGVRVCPHCAFAGGAARNSPSMPIPSMKASIP